MGIYPLAQLGVGLEFLPGLGQRNALGLELGGAGPEPTLAGGLRLGGFALLMGGPLLRGLGHPSSLFFRGAEIQVTPFRG